VDQEKKSPERSFINELIPDLRPTREQVLWAIRITVVVIVVLLVILVFLYVISRLFVFGIELMNLLKVVAVPITVGAAVPLLNWLQKKRELEVENQRAQDEALQAYLDQMTQLLTDKDRTLRQAKEDDEVRSLARARTLTVLARLDGSRKWSVLMFLQEAGLISVEDGSAVSLLQWANLQKADLGEVVLKGADLRETKLQGANLYKADLSGANLSEAKLYGTRFYDADLSNAYLKGAEGITGEELELQTKSLEGATMPDGSKHP
jgi:hypothetical protein